MNGEWLREKFKFIKNIFIKKLCINSLFFYNLFIYGLCNDVEVQNSEEVNQKKWMKFYKNYVEKLINFFFIN